MGGTRNEPCPFNEPHPLTAITMATPTSPPLRLKTGMEPMIRVGVLPSAHA